MPAEVATLAVGLVLNTGKFFAALGTTLNSVTSKMTKWGMLASAAFTVPMVLGLRTVTNAAIDFETAFAGVIKTVAEATDEFGELTEVGKELRQIIRDMAKEIPVVPEELARIGELAGQLGVPIDMLEGFMRTIAMLSVTTDMTIESATMQIARFRNIMGTADQPIDQLASTIVHLGNNSATTESQIMNMAMRIAGAGKIIGLTETEILAMAAAMSSAGIRTEMGGTAISRVLIDIASAVEENDTKLKNLAAVAGVSVGEFARVFEEDAAKALIMFVDGLKRVDAAGGDTFGILETLEMADIRVRETLLKLMSAEFGLADALALANEGWEENTALTKEAEQRFKTTASQIQIFKNTLNDLWITIGEQVTPTIVEFLGRANEIIELVHDWVKINPELTKTLLMVAAAIAVIGPALLLFGKIILPLAAAIIGVALNPLILAFAAVAFAVYKWVTARYHIENLQDAVVAFADIAVKALDWVSERLVSMVDLIGQMAEWGAQAIGAFAQGIVSGLGLVVQAINYVVAGIAALLGPGSPPAAMPNIVKWGQSAINEFLQGMTMADFSILDELGGVIESHLRGLKWESGEALSAALIRARVALARVLAEASAGGEASAEAWADLRREIGDATGELEQYIRARVAAAAAESELAQAELARKQATKQLDDEKYALELKHKAASRQLESEGHAMELRHKEELREVDEKVKTAEEALADFREQTAEIPERFTRGRRKQLEIELSAAQKERDSIKDRQEIEKDEFETRRYRIRELQKIEMEEFETRRRHIMEEADAQVEAAQARREQAKQEADWLGAVIKQKQKIVSLYKEEQEGAEGLGLDLSELTPEALDIGDAIGGIKTEFDKAREAAGKLFGVWKAFWAGLTGVDIDEPLKNLTDEEFRMYKAGQKVNKGWGDLTEAIDKVVVALDPLVQKLGELGGPSLIVGGLSAIFGARLLMMLAPTLIRFGIGIGKFIIGGVVSAISGGVGGIGGLVGGLTGIWEFLFAGAAGIGELSLALGVFAAIVAALIATLRFLWIYGKEALWDLFVGAKGFVDEFLASIDLDRWGPVIDGLIKLWDALKVVFKVVGGVIGTVVIAAFSALGAALPFLGSLLGNFINLLGSLVSVIMTAVIGPLDILWTLFAEGPKAAWEKVLFYMEQGRTAVLGVIESLVAMGVDLITGFSATIIALFAGASEGVLGIIEDLFGKSTTIFGVGLEEIRQGIRQFKDDAVGFFIGLHDEVLAWIGDLVEGALGWFNTLQETLIGGSIIPDMIAQIEGAFGQMEQNVAATGTQMVGGLTTGLMGGIPALTGALPTAVAPGAIAGTQPITINAIGWNFDSSISARDRAALKVAWEASMYQVIEEISG